MAGQMYYCDNDAGSLADILKMAGVAECLGACLGVLGREQSPITIEDQGAYYQIHLPSPLDHATIQGIQQPFAVGRARSFISEPVDEVRRLQGGRFEGFPYAEMQARRADYFDRLKTLSEAERRSFFTHPAAEEFAELQKLTPHPDLRFYAYILKHLKVAHGYNALLSQWSAADIEAFRLNLTFVLECFAETPNDVPGATLRWEQAMKQRKTIYQRDASRWQLSNPTSGKGANAPKAKRLIIKNMKGFWLLEFLKLAGLFTVGVPMTVAGTKDRKLYVLHPLKAEYSLLAEMMGDFRRSFYATAATKLDILIVLRFAQLLAQSLEKTVAPQEGNRSALASMQANLPIADFARGFEVAFYKDMGSALAIMDLATIMLPPWIRSIATIAEARSAQLILDEHISAIRAIQTEQGKEGDEEREVLRYYQDFLAEGTILRFLDFAASYGDYMLGKLRRKEWGRPLTTDRLEKLMAQAQDKKAFSPMLKQEGFQAIAAAIRSSIILAQYYEMRDQGYPFEVRYGLGPQLRSTAPYPEAFLGVLSDFLVSYNAENMRIAKRLEQGSLLNRPAYRRRFLRNKHFNQVVELVDEYGSEVVCKMLLAAGYMLTSKHAVAQAAMNDEDVDPVPPEEVGEA